MVETWLVKKVEGGGVVALLGFCSTFCVGGGGEAEETAKKISLIQFLGSDFSTRYPEQEEITATLHGTYSVC
jgi:hypothetical protein